MIARRILDPRNVCLYIYKMNRHRRTVYNIYIIRCTASYREMDFKTRVQFIYIYIYYTNAMMNYYCWRVVRMTEFRKLIVYDITYVPKANAVDRVLLWTLSNPFWTMWICVDNPNSLDLYKTPRDLAAVELDSDFLFPPETIRNSYYLPYTCVSYTDSNNIWILCRTARGTFIRKTKTKKKNNNLIGAVGRHCGGRTVLTTVVVVV